MTMERKEKDCFSPSLSLPEKLWYVDIMCSCNKEYKRRQKKMNGRIVALRINCIAHCPAILLLLFVSSTSGRRCHQRFVSIDSFEALLLSLSYTNRNWEKESVGKRERKRRTGQRSHCPHPMILLLSIPTTHCHSHYKYRHTFHEQGFPVTCTAS